MIGFDVRLGESNKQIFATPPPRKDTKIYVQFILYYKACTINITYTYKKIIIKQAVC